MLYSELAKRVNPKSPHHREKMFFSILYLYTLMLTKLTVVIISWCKSDHYAIHLKCIQCCMSIYISIRLRKK